MSEVPGYSHNMSDAGPAFPLFAPCRDDSMCAQALKVALGIPFQARPFNVLRRLTEEPQTQQTIMNARAYEW